MPRAVGPAYGAGKTDPREWWSCSWWKPDKPPSTHAGLPRLAYAGPLPQTRPFT